MTSDLLLCRLLSLSPVTSAFAFQLTHARYNRLQSQQMDEIHKNSAENQQLQITQYIHVGFTIAA